MNSPIGQILDGKYRIVRELGTGGMGAVYEGENVRIRRRVAIKLLHAAVSSQAEAVMRFEREAQAAAQIGSDHICEVLDLGVLPDGTRYLVMEYLEGETLGSRIKRSGRMGPLMSIPIMVQVLDALGAAHAAGIIHRDLKPDNIFLLALKQGVTDFVKILDFGVSKFAQSSDEMNMTRAGAVVGTPYYMSPEQARGTSQVDARSDIYALGVLLFQATTGQVPFQAQTFNELLFKIVLEPAPPPQQYAPDLDPEFASIIQKAMAREPTQRFQSCAEFREALVSWMTSRVGPMAMPSPGQRQVTLPPGAGGLRPPTLPTGALTPPGAQPGLSQSQPPWASASGSGMQAPGVSGPPGAPGMLGAPGMQTPPPWANMPGVQTPQTGNAWGNASQPGQAARPQKKGLAVVITAVAIALVGGGALALFMMRREPAPADPPTAATQPVTPTTAPTTAPTAEVVTAPTTEPTAAAPTDTVAAAASASGAAVAPPLTGTPPATTAAVPVTGTGKFRPPPPTTAKPQPQIPGDFGY